jgi:hypothetical protein
MSAESADRVVGRCHIATLRVALRSLRSHRGLGFGVVAVCGAVRSERNFAAGISLC